MKGSYLMIGGALAGLAYLVFGKKSAAGSNQAAPLPAATRAQLLSTLDNQQVTLSTGHVLDTSTGVIYDPSTGNYTNVNTGEIIYKGAGQ